MLYFMVTPPALGEKHSNGFCKCAKLVATRSKVQSQEEQIENSHTLRTRQKAKWRDKILKQEMEIVNSSSKSSTPRLYDY